MNDRPALDPQQAARYLGMCLSKVMRLSHAGEIPCRNVNPGGKHAVFRYSPVALDRWLEGDGKGTGPRVLPSHARPRTRRVREAS
jgi:hypothetical protein